jgi:hypothetical protein
MHKFQKWRDALQIAPNEHTVTGVMRDYLAGIDPGALAKLPAECREALASDDIQSAAVALLHSELTYRGDPDLGEILHEVAHTFAVASVRISRLRGQAAMVPSD